MHMNIYMFFTKYEYFMYFLVSWFFADSGPVHILGFADSMTGPVPITLVCIWNMKPTTCPCILWTLKPNSYELLQQLNVK